MVAAGVVLPDEVSQMLDEVGTIRHWLDRFVALLDGSLVWKEVDDGYVAVLHDDRAYIIMRDEAELGDEEEPEGYNVSYVDPHQNTDTDNNWHHHEKLGTNVATAEMAKEIAQRHADKAEDLRDAATQ
jgi:hypothetical protein